MGAYPPGCTQAMHDRAFADEDREACQACDGTGYITPGITIDEPEECRDCKGTGYETPPDTREDDAYDEARDADIKF